MTCPACGESHPDLVEWLDNGMAFCAECRHAWKPSPAPRLIDPEPPRARRDTDA